MGRRVETSCDSVTKQLQQTENLFQNNMHKCHTQTRRHTHTDRQTHGFGERVRGKLAGENIKLDLLDKGLYSQTWRHGKMSLDKMKRGTA